MAEKLHSQAPMQGVTAEHPITAWVARVKDRPEFSFWADVAACGIDARVLFRTEGPIWQQIREQLEAEWQEEQCLEKGPHDLAESPPVVSEPQPVMDGSLKASHRGIDETVALTFFDHTSFNDDGVRRNLFFRMFPAKGHSYEKDYRHKSFVQHGSTNDKHAPLKTLHAAASGFEALLQHVNRKGAPPESVGFVTCRLKPGPKGYITNSLDCWDGSSMWCWEFDHGSREEQLRWLDLLGLPLTRVESGNRSVHSYLETIEMVEAETVNSFPEEVLACLGDDRDSIEPDKRARIVWQHIRDLLWEAVVRTTGQEPDPLAMKLVQVMRLPGSVHPATGQRVALIGEPAVRSLSVLELYNRLKALCAAGEYEMRRSWQKAQRVAEEHGAAQYGRPGRARRSTEDGDPVLSNSWEKVVEAGRRPRPWIDALPILVRKRVLEECLHQFPPRVPGSKTYGTYRNLLAGIARAVGPDEIEWVVDLFNEHSPEWTEVDARKVAGFLERQQGYNAGTVLQLTRKHLGQPDWLPECEVERRVDPREFEERTRLQQLTTADRYMRDIWPVRVEELLEAGANVNRLRLTASAEMRRVQLDPVEVFQQLPEVLARRMGLPWSGGGDAGPSVGIRTAAEWLKVRSEGDDTGFLVPDFCPRNAITILYGPAGSGKTTQALGLVLAVIKGESFGDSKEPARKLSPGKRVLIVCNDDPTDGVGMVERFCAHRGEENAALLYERCTIWGMKGGREGRNFSFAPGPMVEMERLLRSGEYEMVVVDSLKRSCSLSGLKNSIYDETGLPWLQLLMQMCQWHGVTAVLIHHTNKGRGSGVDRAGGKTDIVELVVAAHYVEYKGRDEIGLHTIDWAAQKVRGSERRSFTMKQNDEGETRIERDPSGEGGRLGNARGEIFSLLEASCGAESFTAAEIVQATNRGKTTVARHLNDMVREGIIIKEQGVSPRGTGRPPEYFRVPQQTSNFKQHMELTPTAELGMTCAPERDLAVDSVSTQWVADSASGLPIDKWESFAEVTDLEGCIDVTAMVVHQRSFGDWDDEGWG